MTTQISEQTLEPRLVGNGRIRWRQVNRGLIALIAVMLGLLVWTVLAGVRESRDRAAVRELFGQYLEAVNPMMIRPSR